MSELLPEQYRCEMCNGVFEFDWSDDEARAEAKKNGFYIPGCAVVCDDCYNEVMKIRHERS